MSFKNMIRRALRFVVAPLEAEIAELRGRLDDARDRERIEAAAAETRDSLAYLQNVAIRELRGDVASLAREIVTKTRLNHASIVDLRSELAGLGREIVTKVRVNDAVIADLRGVLRGLSRDIVAQAARLVILEGELVSAAAAIGMTASQTDLATTERGLSLRMDADANAASAHRSFVEREVERVENRLSEATLVATARIDHIESAVRRLTAIAELSASLSAHAGALGIVRPEEADGPLPVLFASELRQLERLLGSEEGMGSANGRGASLRPQRW